MTPVEQRYMAIFDERGDPVQRGDCLRACVASLFDLDVDDVPHFSAHEDWAGSYARWMRERGYVIGSPRITTDEGDPTVLRGRPMDGIYWIGTVKSPRGRVRCAVCKGEGVAIEQWLGDEEEYVEHETPQPCVECDSSGLVPSLHAVVMCGGDLVWDPHPRRDMGHLGFVRGEWFIAADPGRFALMSESAAA